MVTLLRDECGRHREPLKGQCRFCAAARAPGQAGRYRAGLGTKSRTGHRAASRSAGTGPAIRHSPESFPFGV